MNRYVVLDKKVGETPLACLEAYRAGRPELMGVPMAYAGRLDPMASGKLLVLLGEECKVQEKYHALDKEYSFTVLLGVASDTGDVLGRLTHGDVPEVSEANLRHIAGEFSGKDATFPYPNFSSKTIQGKPLHMWTLEGRLGEIKIPTYTARVYSLKFGGLETKTGSEIAEAALLKIETIPPVTDERKALGQDFRRNDVRKDWAAFKEAHGGDTYTLATFTCISSSGAYMRTLSEEIAKKAGTIGLAYAIDRKAIGTYRKLGSFGLWARKFK